MISSVNYYAYNVLHEVLDMELFTGMINTKSAISWTVL